jgi:two-component system NtrC family response regulator
LSGNQDRANALKAVAMGAYDFHHKPCEPELLGLVIERAFVLHAMQAENQRMLQIQSDSPLAGIVTRDPAMLRLCRSIEKLAPSSATVMLLGDSGSGKELFARGLHELSGRSEHRFVAINCAAIPADLLESELFGHEKGAFTGAGQQTLGKIEMAQGGTFFLDEIGDMAMALQAKLLRFVQDRMMTPVGATLPRKIDTRILAATNRVSPPSSGHDVGLRLDLVARLGAEPMRLPPLREHLEDLGALAAHFLRGSDRRLTAPALRALHLHSWPGNVRELEKALQEAQVLSRGTSAIDLEHLPSRIDGAQRPAPAPASAPRPAPTAPELEELLQRHKGNMTHVARELGRQPALVYRWAERFQLDPETYRQKGASRAAVGRPR